MPKNKEWKPSKDSAAIIIDRLLHEGPLYTPDLDNQSKKIKSDFKGNKMTEDGKPRIKHSTLRKLLEQLEYDFKIERLDSDRKTPSGQEIHRYGLTFIGFRDWLDNSNHSGTKITDPISFCKKWIPWIYDNWNVLEKLYDERSMFEYLVSISKQIDIDDDHVNVTNNGKTVTGIKITRYYERELSSEFVNPYEHYSHILTRYFIHGLMMSSISNTEFEVIPKKSNSGARLLQLIKSNNKIWSSYKENIKSLMNIQRYELKSLEKINAAIVKTESM